MCASASIGKAKASGNTHLPNASCANIFAEGEIFRPMTHEALVPRTQRIHLTRRESQIMETLHRRQKATVEEIRAALPDAPTPSSVRKLLDIMIERGLIGREYDGPRFVYFPAAAPEDARRSA